MKPSTKEPIQVKRNMVTLRHLAYAAAELTKLQCAWVPGVALWELKLQLARNQWENAHHAQGLRERVKDFPGGKPDGHIHPKLVTLMEVITAAPSGPAFIQGVYGAFKPGLVRWYKKQLEETDSIVDQPTVYVLEQAVTQEQQQIRRVMDLYAGWRLSEGEQQEALQWKAYIESLLQQGMDWTAPDEENWRQLEAYDRYRPSPIGMRDDRFQTSFYQVTPEAPHLDEATLYEVKVVVTYLREMQATETVATSLYEMRNMPWEFYYETSRHCWDEARHCMLGQRRLEQLGFDITSIPCMNGNYAVRQLLDPLYRYAYITMVEEAGSMKPKRDRVQELEALGKSLTARLVEYDLADERNHVENGFRWLPQMLKARGDDRTLDQVVEEARKLRNQAYELIRIDYEGY